MKKLIKFVLVVALMFGGWTLAAASLHLVRAPGTMAFGYIPFKVQLITKNAITFRDTYVDTTKWSVADAQAAPGLRQPPRPVEQVRPRRPTSSPPPTPTPRPPPCPPRPSRLPKASSQASSETPREEHLRLQPLSTGRYSIQRGDDPSGPSPRSFQDGNGSRGANGRAGRGLILQRLSGRSR